MGKYLTEKHELKIKSEAKFDSLVSKRYKRANEKTLNNAYRRFYADYLNQNDEDISQKVRKWRGLDKQNESYIPAIEDLLKICNVLDCDIDYLLSDQEQPRKEISSASDYLNIKYEAAEKIKNYHEKTIVNAMIENIDLLDKAIDTFYTNLGASIQIAGEKAKENEEQAIKEYMANKILQQFFAEVTHDREVTNAFYRSVHIRKEKEIIRKLEEQYPDAKSDIEHHKKMIEELENTNFYEEMLKK